jgi:hypothetical protein
MSEEQNFIYSEKMEMAITVPGKQKCPKYGQLCMLLQNYISILLIFFIPIGWRIWASWGGGRLRTGEDGGEVANSTSEIST